MFENQTKASILSRLLGAMDASLDKREGSVVYDLSSPAAIELAMIYNNLDLMLKFGFVSSDMPKEYLDLRASEVGLTRKPAIKATGQVKFIDGYADLIIPAGTRVSTSGKVPVTFITEASIMLDVNGEGFVSVIAEVGGASGNVAAGSIDNVVGLLSGVVGVTNALDFIDGVDEESDEALMARYFEKVQHPATSGNVHHYRQWALEVSGVGDAKVYPLWNGNGTVKVVIIDSDKRADGIELLVTNTADYIETVRPVGATVTVEAASETPIGISATLTLEAGKVIADVLPSIEADITEYLKGLAFKDSIVRYSKLANIILDTAGVVDYANLTVNGGTGNTVIAEGAIAVKGTVNLV